MLSGRPPFTAEGVGELFAKHMLEEPPSVTEFAPNAPPHMAAAIMKALAKDPAARFQNMEDFRKAIVGEVKLAPPATNPARRSLNNQANTMAQTISARASTTLSSASSEIDDVALEIKPKRTKLFVALGGGAALLAVGYFALSGQGKDKTSHPTTPPIATTTTTPVAPPQPPVAPPTPAKKTVTIRFEAEPAGAHVFRKKDDKDLGVVPVEIQLAKDAAKAGPDGLAYVLRLPGYKERPLTADVGMDRTFHVSLEKAPAPVDPKKNKNPGHRGPRRPRSPVDEDGLATPSF